MKTIAIHEVMRLVCIAVVLGSLTTGCASAGGTGVTARSVPVTPAPKASGQPIVKLSTFPQKFEVQGDRASVFDFAVTQPGPLTVDVQVQGTPVIVMLQSPGGQPMMQRGIGNLRLNYNVTPADVQRNLFWQVQIRSWCEEDCLKAAANQQRSVGSIIVQYPPVDQGAVQRAMGMSPPR